MSAPNTQETSRTENVARFLVSELRFADIRSDERLFLQDLLEQIRPRVVDSSVFDGYHERQAELCAPFSRRFSMLHSAHSYDQYGLPATRTVNDVLSILALTGVNWQELVTMNELQVARFLSKREVDRLILFLMVLQALVVDSVESQTV